MKKLILFLLLILVLSCNQKQVYNIELLPYTNFLEKDHKKAKDYVLDLFEKNDLVIICERDHRENTQYEFLNELISDPKFIQNVGNIFTEVGMRSLNPEINNFIHSTDVANNTKKDKIIELQRRCSFYPIWEMYNFYSQVEGIYEINQALSQSEKINLYPTDVELKLDSINVDYLKKFWYNEANNRDSLMADYIIENFEKIKKSETKRKKALIIMNYRHGFNNNFKQADGSNFDNVGSFLFDKYPGNIANVLINPLGILESKSDIDITWIALQNGRWDAAFKVSKKNNIGFDFKSTPFGKDKFDYWTFTPHKNNYQDIYTGFVYYESPTDFKIITGVDGLVDSLFLETYKKRVSLWNKVVGDRLGNETQDSLIFKKYNRKNISKIEKIDTIASQIDRWLK